jgi:arylsulfatase
VPSLARWPGKIPTGKVTNAVAATIDLAPTLIRICGAQPPALPLDGVDISPVLTGSRDAVERDVIVYFMDWNAQCARWRDWKLHLSRYNVVRYAVEPRPTPVNCLLRPPELYNLALDPGESYDVAPENPQVVQEITRRFERVLATMPEQVQKAFKDTQSAKCAHLPAGAPPRPEGIKY